MVDQHDVGRRVPIESQDVSAPLTSAAVFLVLSVQPGESAATTVRSVLGSVPDLVKTVSFRDLSANLSCRVGIGAQVWPRIVAGAPPKELHPFAEIRGDHHTAVSTPGDLLLHIVANRRDLCFELERILLDQLGDAVTVVDETVGFRYFDARDLLGFVDGTANPVGPDLTASALVGEEDPDHRGGSYVVTQKYLHRLDEWSARTVEQQEAAIGRTKLDNIELDDAEHGQKAHKTLATIDDPDLGELDILRDNMPFGSPGAGEYGTYFIGYTRRLWVLEKMLQRMFIGDPPGLHDPILDVSTPVTGSVFFLPSAPALAALGD